MAQVYDSIDLYFTEEGDYLIDAYGDVKDTAENPLRGLIQAVQSACQYEAGEWRDHPTFGLTLIPIGNFNTPAVAEMFDNSIFAALTASRIVEPEDLEVQSFPVAWDALMTMLSISYMSGNGLYNDGTIIISPVFDFKSKRVMYF